MLALQNASLARGGRRLVDNVSLTLAPGCVTVIVGPNGAGKSTVMKLLSGEVRPSAGRVMLAGQPIHRLRPHHLAARRAVLAQSTEAAFGFTVRELSALGLHMLGAPFPRTEQARLVARALDRVGLAGLGDRTIGDLSGGERQRAHLARVLVQLWAGGLRHGPGTLLLDEPIAAQDLAHQLHILDIARAHADQAGTVAIVLHDLNWAAAIGDRLIALRHGRVYADGTPAEVLTQTMLADVFDVDLKPGALPAAGRPFVLPQLAATRRPDNAPPTPTHRRPACTSP